MKQPPGLAQQDLNLPLDAEQRKVQACAFALAVCFAVLVSAALAALGFARLSTACSIQLQQTINPNNAPRASLLRLPGIGTGRAGAIIEYRRNYNIERPSSKAFESTQDLQKLKGFGPRTVANISPWLRFEEE
jgi:DNA uptake protein ComE-like DNA-binding protein